MVQHEPGAFMNNGIAKIFVQDVFEWEQLIARRDIDIPYLWPPWTSHLRFEIRLKPVPIGYD